MNSLEQLRTVKRADVWKQDAHVATLVRKEDGGVTFAYLPGYAGPPVAKSLPVVDGGVDSQGGALPAFFTGLLPEGHRLSVIRKLVKTSLDDELSLLLAIGNDLPGDVRVVPTGTKPVPPVQQGEPGHLDFQPLTETVETQGLAGVQGKASASMINTPLTIDRGDYILKLSSAEYPQLVENEHLHLQHAAKLGIPVAQSQLVQDRNGVSGLLVQRFDRYGGRRLPLEDATQILNIPPSQKYNVTAEEVTQALAEVTAQPRIAARTLYLQLVFAWLTGNGDCHAKNVSVVQNVAGNWEVAPMYDIPCTAVYRDFTLALTVNGKTKNLRARDWDAFAESISLPLKAAHGANEIALTVASGINLAEIPVEGSALYGAERELRFRRSQLEP